MANEQGKTGSTTGTGVGTGDASASHNESSGGMGGFGRTEMPGGRTAITVPASMSQVLEPKRLLWYGGLAALGVVGVIEWPVLAVVGAATYVSQRFAQDDQNRQR